METNLLIFLAAAALCIVLIAKLAHRLMATGSTNSSDESQKGGRGQMSGYEPSSPSEGNAKEMAEAGSFVDFLLNSHEKLGDMFYFYMGTRKYISIASPELMKQMAGIFDRDGMLYSTFRPLIGDQSIQFANGEEGRKRRQLQDKSYSHTAVMKGISLFQQEAMSIVNKWSTLPEGEHVALTDAFYMFALKVQSVFSFSDSFKDESKLKMFVDAYNVTITICDETMVTGPMKKGTEQYRRFYEAKSTLRQMIDETIHLREETEVAPDDKNFLDSLLDGYDNDDMIFDDCITYLIGGSHTTSFFLVWCVYYLSLYPEVQTRLREEINEHHVKGDPITPDVFKQLPYLHAVIDESMRLSRLAPFAARCPDYDFKLGDYDIPANTPVVQCFGAALHNKRIFKNPKEFNPERFMPNQKQQLPPYAYEPFGFAGKRKCPGYRLSLTEAQVFLITLLEHLQVSLVPGQTVESDFGLLTRPKAEIWITVSKAK